MGGFTFGDAGIARASRNQKGCFGKRMGANESKILLLFFIRMPPLVCPTRFSCAALLRMKAVISPFGLHAGESGVAAPVFAKLRRGKSLGHRTP